MKITKITVYPYNGTNGETLKGFASVEFDKCFVVSGIRIIDGARGLFISMPSNKGTDGEYHDVCFPVTKEYRTELQDEIVDEYLHTKKRK